MVKARMRFEAVWQGHGSLLHQLHPSVILEEKHVFLPSSFHKLITLLQKLVLFAAQTLWKLGLKRSRFLGLFPKILTWDVWGGAQESTFIGRIQWFKHKLFTDFLAHSLRGHSNSAFKSWPCCRVDAQLQETGNLFELKISRLSDGVCCLFLWGTELNGITYIKGVHRLNNQLSV